MRNDVLVNIEYILGELRKIKTCMGITQQIESPSVDIAPTFSAIYKRLSDASFMLDGTTRTGAGRQTMSIKNALRILEDLALVSESLQTQLNYELAPVEGTTKTIDVALQILRARHKLIDLQTAAPNGRVPRCRP